MDSRGAAAEALHRVEAERDALAAERDRLRDAGDAVSRAEADRDAAMKERDRLRRRLNEVARPPDTGAAAAEQLVRLTARLDAVTAERDRLAALKGPAAAGVSEAPAIRTPPVIIDDLRPQPPAAPAVPTSSVGPAERSWTVRAAALLALIAVIAVLAFVLQAVL